ncbi:MAG TPA: ABC transporter substrate-binding protein [Aggregatilineales bacterium]|nr:ABC transporter substrate-binding protein [Aggregatilineales bacterium]
MKSQIRRHAMPLVLLSVLVGATACGNDAGSVSSDEALDCSKAPTAAGDPATIRIAYGKAAEEPLWLMDAMPSLTPHQGKSYELEMRQYDDAEKKLVAYQASEVDAVVAPAPAQIVGTAKGALNLVTLFTVMQEAGEGSFGTTFVVKPDSGIDDVEDLTGKAVGIHDFRSTPDFLIRLALQKAGLQTSDVDFVTIPFPAQLEALNAGVIDAAVVVEPFAAMARNSENPPEVLFTSRDVTGYAYDQLLLSVDRDFAAENLRAVCDFRDDYAETLAWYKQNVEEAKQAIVDAGYVDLPFDLYLQSQDYAQPDGGNFDPSSLELLMDDMISVGLLDEDQRVDVEELYAPGFTAGH